MCARLFRLDGDVAWLVSSFREFGIERSRAAQMHNTGWHRHCDPRSRPKFARTSAGVQQELCVFVSVVSVGLRFDARHAALLEIVGPRMLNGS